MKIETIDKINEVRKEIKATKDKILHLQWLTCNGTKKYKLRIENGLSDFYVFVDLVPSIEEFEKEVLLKTRELLELGVEL